MKTSEPKGFPFREVPKNRLNIEIIIKKVKDLIMINSGDALELFSVKPVGFYPTEESLQKANIELENEIKKILNKIKDGQELKSSEKNILVSNFKLI